MRANWPAFGSAALLVCGSAWLVVQLLPESRGTRAAPGSADPCLAELPAYYARLEADPDDVEALKGIVACRRPDDLEALADETSRLFAESQVLKVVPELLEQLEIKEHVPILSEVETDPDARIPRMLVDGRMRRQLGDPKRAIALFEEVVSLDPDNAEAHLQLGYSRLARGDLAAARAAFRAALGKERQRLRITHLYAIAVAWPWPFLGIVTGLIGLGGALWWRRQRAVDFLERSAADQRVGQLTAGLVAISVGLPGAVFVATANELAFLLLLALALGSVVWLASSPFRAPLARAARWLRDLVAGRGHERLVRLPLGLQAAILVLTGFLVVIGLPLVPNVDLRIASFFLLMMLLFSSVGSLLRTMMAESRSLRATLQWIGLAGTVPFVLYFLYVELDTIGGALRAGLLVQSGTRDRVAALVVLVLVTGGFAALLARILSGSILGPVEAIVGTLHRVRNGDFQARVQVHRKDELALLADAVNEMAAGLRQREELRTTFKRYVNPNAAERILAGDRSVRRGRVTHATVLFSDVRGFTALSERLPPEEIVELLNAYFARMEPIVRRWGGVVDKFLGDGILAVWDVPEPPAGSELPGELRAVLAALDMTRELDRFNGELEQRGLRKLGIGIGINAGPLIAGPVGSPERLEYTVIGDTVNTAERVESVARGAANLLVTEAVAEVLADRIDLEPIEPVAVKGKARPLRLYHVRGLLRDGIGAVAEARGR